MKTIRQGKPEHGYFTVLQPAPGGNVEVGDQVECINPRTHKTIAGVCAGVWTFDWVCLPDGFCLLTFGVDAKTLKIAIEASKEEFRNKEKVSFLLIKSTT
jgi:hypothetical protein